MKLFMSILLLTLSLLQNSLAFEIGVNIDNPTQIESDFEAAYSLRIKYIRIWFWWMWLEGEQGKIDWHRMDSQVKWAKERGLEIYATFAGVPHWANGSDKKCELWKGECSAPPKKIEYYTNFLNQVVERYKYDIKYWGLWNEPNLKIFWNPKTNNQSQIIRSFINTIQIPGYNVIKKIDPRLKIVGPDLSQDDKEYNCKSLSDRLLNKCEKNNSFYKDWLIALFKEKPSTNESNGYYFDIFSHHVYESPTNTIKSLKKEVYSLLENFNVQNKPFWLTEIGFNSCEKKQNTSGFQKRELKKLIDGVNKEFVYTKSKKRIRMNNWLNRIYYFDINDPTVLEKQGLCRGLTRSDGSIKPSGKFLYSILPPLPSKPVNYKVNTNEEISELKLKMFHFIFENKKVDPLKTLNWWSWNYYYQLVTGQMGPDLIHVLRSNLNSQEDYFTSSELLKMGLNEEGSLHFESQYTFNQWRILSEDYIRIPGLKSK